MSKSIKIIGIIVIIVLITALAVFLTMNKQPGAPSGQTPMTENTNPTQKVVSPSQTSTITPKTETNSTKYTAEFREKVRNIFIANCKIKIGQQYTKECTCGADYLASHYTDTELEKVYLEYHSSTSVPKEIQAAYDACK
jgi:hypothetical protein